MTRAVAPAATARDAEHGTRVVVIYGFGYEPNVRLRKMTRSLTGEGFDVTILAWDRSASLPRHDREGAVRIDRIAIRSRRGRGLVQLVFLARVGIAMIRRLRRERPHVIHAVDLPMLVIAVIARSMSVRSVLVYDAFEIYSLMVAHRFPKPIVAAIRRLEERLPRAADLVITAGTSRSAWFERRGINSISVPNWPDHGAIAEVEPASQAERLAARSALGIEATQFCLAYAGALLGSRDLESLLRFARRHAGDVVVIAGVGDREAWLRDATHDLPNVRLLGWLPDPSVVFRAADAMYYALRADHPYAPFAAPNNLYVAIANAVPLIFRAQGELQEAHRKHTLGRPFEDDATLDEAVAALRDPDEAERIRAGLRELRQAYTWEAAVRPLLDLYPRSDRPRSSDKAKAP